MGSFQKATGKSIDEAFAIYHKLNPEVYVAFKKYAFTAINAGKKKISAKLIINQIRWQYFLLTEEPTLFEVGGKVRQFKLNDIYGSRYARLFIHDFPEHQTKLELRELRS